jgi:hypothetical protein
MQRTQQDHMMDRCTVLSRKESAEPNARGYKTPRYVETCFCVPCGLQHSKTNTEAMLKSAEGTQVPMFDGSLRLPLATDISGLDRVRITHRFGVAVDDGELLEIVGEPRRGPSGLYANVKRVQILEDA